MYVFSRSRHVNNASVREAVAGAVEIAGLAAGIAGIQIDTWTTIASRDAGRITWAAFFETLADFDTANQKLNASKEYGDWVDANDKLYVGPIEDSMLQVIHGAPDPARTFNILFVVNNRAVNGKVGEATAASIEIADLITKISGSPTLVCTSLTGPYGSLVTVGGLEKMADFDQLLAAINADPSFTGRVDEVGPLVQPDNDIVWYQRLG
jgi:hypothetical protein